MPDNLLRKNNVGEPNGLNFLAIKNFIEKSTPFHLDLQPYLLAHYRAKSSFIEELARQASNWEITTWTPEIIKAFSYIERLIDCILEADETTFACDLRNHHSGAVCPNRRHLTLPDPEE